MGTFDAVARASSDAVSWPYARATHLNAHVFGRGLKSDPIIWTTLNTSYSAGGFSVHTFSGFWLRSSVVSVLISLISDTDLIEIEDIKLIFDVARIASGLPVLSVTGCLCIAVSQSTADPARGSPR